MAALAIFDLDNTLIAGDSDYGWGLFLVDKGKVDPEDYRRMNDKFYQDYRQGRLDIFEYLRFALQPLAALPPEELSALHRQFMVEVIEPLWLKKAVTLIQRHRQAGDILMVITSTNRFIAEPICNKLGISEIIATELETNRHGHYTGRVAGVPAYREGKVSRLKDWLAANDQNLRGSTFYSDSINDLPLLEVVERPIAVDPDDKLLAVAKDRHWSVISLRD